MSNTQHDNPFRTFLAGEALAANRRVKLSGANTVVYADAGEDCVAVTIDKAASGAPVNTKLWSQGGTHLIESAGAITAAAAVYGADDGKMDDSASGERIGFATEAASAAAKMTEMVVSSGATAVQSHVADVTVTTDLTGVDTGTDMTAAQAAQIEADLAAIAAAIAATNANLEAVGINATS